LFPPDAPPEETRCATLGVFAPLVGMMGVMQAGEALKLLAGIKAGHEPLTGRLLMVDGRDWRVTSLKVRRDPGCTVCGTAAPMA
jgi:molybdopterin/thiamine biosynthesis adenylyltransferase